MLINIGTLITPCRRREWTGASHKSHPSKARGFPEANASGPVRSICRPAIWIKRIPYRMESKSNLSFQMSTIRVAPSISHYICLLALFHQQLSPNLWIAVEASVPTLQYPLKIADFLDAADGRCSAATRYRYRLGKTDSSQHAEKWFDNILLIRIDCCVFRIKCKRNTIEAIFLLFL